MAPKRRTAFDGLTPADFLGVDQQQRGGQWPFGPFALPKALKDLPVEERTLVLETVTALAREVAEHLRWCEAHRWTRVTAAKKAHVSQNRLLEFEKGRRWPDWDLPLRLRAVHAAEAATRRSRDS